MHRMTEILLTDLRYLLADLGNDQGLIGPSLYDTAQVVRLAPPADVWPTLDWLRDQQQPDGGWGTQPAPRARDVPTLAVVLALRKHGTRAHDRTAIEAGLDFLRRQRPHWQAALPDDLPVGAELILPALLDDALRAGLTMDLAPYVELRALGQRRLQQIAAIRPRASTTPVYSWEAWGTEPDPALQDRNGGIGHSPSATAAWMHAAAGRPELADACAVARRYLEGANRSTGVGLPGVTPIGWPVPFFEIPFAIYPLVLADLIDHPTLAPIIAPKLQALQRAIGPRGIGMSDEFIHDGDITATTIFVLAAGGIRLDPALVQYFAHPTSGLFTTYPNELQPSISTTVHAAHALTYLGLPPSHTIQALIAQRQPNGRWLGDKWHSSWLYLTSHTLRLLLDARCLDIAQLGLPTILDSQNTAGSWGSQQPTLEETAHGVLALLSFDRYGLLPEASKQALHRAVRWMLQHYHPATEAPDALWISKELYRPRRVAQAYELCAMLGGVLRGYGI